MNDSVCKFNYSYTEKHFVTQLCQIDGTEQENKYVLNVTRKIRKIN